MQGHGNQRGMIPSIPTHFPLPTTGKVKFENVHASPKSPILIHNDSSGFKSRTGLTFRNHRNTCHTLAFAPQVFCNPAVRVGNWKEDVLEQEELEQDLLTKHSLGSLGRGQIDDRIAYAETPVCLS
jgi:hypothetical protein